MSTLSKVFVVLVLLAAIALAMSSMARLATTDDYKTRLKNETALKELWSDSAARAVAQLTSERDAHSNTRATLSSQIADKDTEIAGLKTDKDVLEKEVGSLKTGQEDMRADLQNVKDELVKAQDDIKRLHSERDAAVKRAADFEEARLDAEQNLRESQNRVKNLRAEVANLEVQLRTHIQRVTKLQKILDDRGIVDTGRAPVKKIDALVTEVQRRDADVWVQVSAGKANEVKPGMKFIIFGEGTYKGDVQISKVFEDSAIGRLIQSGTKEVMTGDKATTSLKED